MERNPNDNFNQESNRGGSSGGQYGGTGGSTGGQYGGNPESGYGSQGGAGSQGGYGAQGGYGSAGGAGTGAGYGSTGAGAGYGTGGAYGGQEGRMEQAREKAGELRDRAGELASSVGERAGNLKSTLADKLEAGANRLRGQDFGDGSTAGLQGSQQRSQVTSRVAGGMQATADWLRNAEMDDLRTGIERQARENPGRTLLIALGVGYLLGKAFRR